MNVPAASILPHLQPELYYEKIKPLSRNNCGINNYLNRNTYCIEDYSPYNFARVGDYFGNLEDICRKYNFRFGFYFSKEESEINKFRNNINGFVIERLASFHVLEGDHYIHQAPVLISDEVIHHPVHFVVGIHFSAHVQVRVEDQMKNSRLGSFPRQDCLALEGAAIFHLNFLISASLLKQY